MSRETIVDQGHSTDRQEWIVSRTSRSASPSGVRILADQTSLTRIDAGRRRADYDSKFESEIARLPLESD